MSWLKLDDGILDHPKFVRAERLAGSTAFHLWVGLVSYCKQHLTDGHVPIDMLPTVNGPAQRWRTRALDALRVVGLVEVRDGAVLVHDYLDWNESRDEIERKRSARRGKVLPQGERRVSVGGASMERRRSVDGAFAAANDHDDLAARRKPSETETETETETEVREKPVTAQAPTPTPKKKPSARAGKRICPADFEPDATTRQLAIDLGFSATLERATRARMIDWSESKGRAMANWQATYRNWLRTTAEDRGLKPPKRDAQWAEHQRQLREAERSPVKAAPPPREFDTKVRSLFG